MRDMRHEAAFLLIPAKTAEIADQSNPISSIYFFLPLFPLYTFFAESPRRETSHVTASLKSRDLASTYPLEHHKYHEYHKYHKHHNINHGNDKLSPHPFPSAADKHPRRRRRRRRRQTTNIDPTLPSSPPLLRPPAVG